MNKVRILGAAILLLSIALQYFIEIEQYNFLIGAAGGMGIGLLVLGRIRSPRK